MGIRRASWPLRIFGNVLRVTRGESVLGERASDGQALVLVVKPQ